MDQLGTLSAVVNLTGVKEALQQSRRLAGDWVLVFTKLN